MRKGLAEDLLRDIKEFARFFSSLWGLLAGGSLFFPFLNSVIEAVPYPHEALRQVSSVLALLGSAFIFLLVYMARYLVSKLDDENLRLPTWMGYRRLPLAGYRSPILSTLIFILFIVLLIDYLDSVWSVWSRLNSWEADRAITGVFEYGLIFMLATLAFSVLGTSEYMRQLSRLQKSQQQGWPSSETGLSAIYTRLRESERPRYLSELVIVSEVRSNQDGTPILQMIVQSKSGNRYEVKVDRSGNVLEFRRHE